MRSFLSCVISHFHVHERVCVSIRDGFYGAQTNKIAGKKFTRTVAVVRCMYINSPAQSSSRHFGRRHHLRSIDNSPFMPFLCLTRPHVHSWHGIIGWPASRPLVQHSSRPAADALIALFFVVCVVFSAFFGKCAFVRALVLLPFDFINSFLP